MADTAGQLDLRGLNIDKVSKDMLEETLIFKKEVKVESTDAREVRWYQKTSGYLTATAAAKISPVAYGARPFVLEQSWTRNTSYVKKYFLESPLINMEDESDNDVQVVLNNAQDITAAIANDLDGDIYSVATENDTPVNINTVAATAAWDAESGQDPYKDVSEAQKEIREQTKDGNLSLALYVTAKDYDSLKVWLVSTKGSSIPGFSSQIVEKGTIMMFDGMRVVITENVTADKALIGDLKKSVVYKEFKALTTIFIKEEGIGRRIRSWTHGIALLVRPKYNCLITNTQA